MLYLCRNRTFLNPGLMLKKHKLDEILKKVLFRDGNDFKDDKDAFWFVLFKDPTVPKFNSDNKKGTFVKEWDDLKRDMDMNFRLDI